MNKNLVPTWLVISIAGLCFASPLHAQKQESDKPKASAKVAKVDLKVVYENYERAKPLLAEIQETLKPQIAKAKKLGGGVVSPFFYEPQYSFDWSRQPEAVEKKNRELKELKDEMARIIDQKHGDMVITLKREVNMAIKAVAQYHGIDVVISNGVKDFMPKDLFSRLENDARSTERHGVGPVYVNSDADIPDITEHVSKTLRHWLAAAKEGAQK